MYLFFFLHIFLVRNQTIFKSVEQIVVEIAGNNPFPHHIQLFTPSEIVVLTSFVNKNINKYPYYQSKNSLTYFPHSLNCGTHKLIRNNVLKFLEMVWGLECYVMSEILNWSKKRVLDGFERTCLDCD